MLPWHGNEGGLKCSPIQLLADTICLVLPHEPSDHTLDEQAQGKSNNYPVRMDGEADCHFALLLLATVLWVFWTSNSYPPKPLSLIGAC